MKNEDWKQKPLPQAMAFFHGDGFVQAWKDAVRFAGDGGWPATMEDVVDARLATADRLIAGDPRMGSGITAWESYVTTLSAEYVGLSRGGNPVVIVAHGVGPMSVSGGVMRAYKHEYDHPRERDGGRITRQEFLELESGEYGDVSVVDLKGIVARYRYPFIEGLTAADAILEPLMQARLGRRWREYIETHHRIAMQARREDDPAGRMPSPIILQMEASSPCYYPHLVQHPEVHWDVASGEAAFAHLLVMGGLMNMNQQHRPDGRYYPSLCSGTDMHGWTNGTRIVGVRAGRISGDIHPGPSDLGAKMRKHWERIAVPVKNPERRRDDFFRLRDGRAFTCYQSRGKELQSSEPEFKVLKAERIGKPMEFRTKIEGYHGIFRYDVRDVRRMAPGGANAFTFGEPKIAPNDGDPKEHVCPVTFYKAEVDVSRRIPREGEIRRDFDLTMSLVLSG